jgi:hypothetical protein
MRSVQPILHAYKLPLLDSAWQSIDGTQTRNRDDERGVGQGEGPPYPDFVGVVPGGRRNTVPRNKATGSPPRVVTSTV